MAAPSLRRAAAKKPAQPKQPRNLELRVRVSAAELSELQILGDRGDFATNIRKILLDKARGELTKIPNARELRRLQKYLIIDRQARLVRQDYKGHPKDPVEQLLRAIEQLGKISEEFDASATVE